MSRFELKYEINRKYLEYVKSHLSVIGDFSKSYHVSSTYFDDWRKSAFHSKLDGEYERTKIRIRSYTEKFNSSDVLYLEKKTRSGQMISKERFKITPDFFTEAIEGNNTHPWLAGLTPQLTIYYFRKEYVLSWGRITLDNDITFQWNGFEKKYRDAILEIKTEKPFDASQFKWLHELSKVQSFSKYATGMTIKAGLHVE